MREVLKALAGKRFRVYAVVQKFGKKPAFKGEPKDTVCLYDLRDKHGYLLTDHLWLTMGVQLKRMGLKIGEKISFSARISSYVKGYKGRRQDVRRPPELDYRLSNPTKFQRLSEIAQPIKTGLFEWSE